MTDTYDFSSFWHFRMVGSLIDFAIHLLHFN